MFGRFDQPTFESARMLLGIVDEEICIQSLRHLRDNGLGAPAQRILSLPANATTADIVARVEAMAAESDEEDAADMVAWLKEAAAKL